MSIDVRKSDIHYSLVRHIANEMSSHLVQRRKKYLNYIYAVAIHKGMNISDNDDTHAYLVARFIGEYCMPKKFTLQINGEVVQNRLNRNDGIIIEVEIESMPNHTKSAMNI